MKRVTKGKTKSSPRSFPVSKQGWGARMKWLLLFLKRLNPAVYSRSTARSMWVALKFGSAKWRPSLCSLLRRVWTPILCHKSMSTSKRSRSKSLSWILRSASRARQVFLSSTSNPTFKLPKSLRRKKKGRLVKPWPRCYKRTWKYSNQCRSRRRKSKPVSWKKHSRQGSKRWKLYQKNKRSIPNSRQHGGKVPEPSSLS